MAVASISNPVPLYTAAGRPTPLAPVASAPSIAMDSYNPAPGGIAAPAAHKPGKLFGLAGAVGGFFAGRILGGRILLGGLLKTSFGQSLMSIAKTGRGGPVYAMLGLGLGAIGLTTWLGWKAGHHFDKQQAKPTP